MNVLLSTGAIVGIAVAAVVILLIISIIGWWISKMNWFRRMQVKINENASGIDVALAKRFDLLTKQYNIAKGYAKHENETLIDVAKMRANYHEGTANVKEMNEFNANMNSLARGISIIVERYPDLKANTMFLSLSNSCTDVEEHIQAARRLYNADVSSYNQGIVSFPSFIVANAIHATAAEFFKVEEEKREDVKMEF